jgi:hypothetical protein
LILDEKLYDLVKHFANSPFKDLSKVPLSYKSKRPPGYWKNFDNVKNELLPHCQKIGRMLTPRELKKVGLGQIATIAKMYYGDLKNVANRLGYIYPEK